MDNSLALRKARILSRGGKLRLPPIDKDRYDEIEARLMSASEDGSFQEEDLPLQHYFAPGLYTRSVFMRKGIFVLSKHHLTSELNVIRYGRAIVRSGDKLHIVQGPCTFESPANIRKALFILEDTLWFTVHQNPDDIRDVQQLEEMLVDTTNAWKAHRKLLAHRNNECRLLA